MEKFQTIQIEFDGSVVTLWLSRPEVHNALNSAMIREISQVFATLEEKKSIRMVVIRGKGASFCSGADLREMKSAISLEPEENLRECQELSGLFASIFNSSKIVVAVVHGNVFGGGNGLVAAADLAFGTSTSRFSLSETRIGMAAASITPYLLQKISSSELKELVFTAREFTGNEAVSNGLLNQSYATTEELELKLASLIHQIQKNGKTAMATSKKLINNLTMLPWSRQLEQIPELLAKIRISPEAQEGFSAFLEKRRPNWEQ